MGRRTMLLVAAFVVAALGTTLVFLYVNGVNDRAVADQKQVRVLVATG
jgi:pilus assembly protein CpaB